MSAREVLVAIPAGAVATGAMLATGHGLHEVAIAATVPDPLAWVYPVITDGLAFVAYLTAHQVPAHKRYAWTVVVIASLMSGIAQAVYLADGAVSAPVALRFAIGFWPAPAGMIVGHMLYLLWRAWAAEAARRAAVLAEERRVAAEAQAAAEAAARAAEEAARRAAADRETADPNEQQQQSGGGSGAKARRPAASTPRRRASADDVDQDRARELVESGKFGRVTLARELGTTKSIARTLIDRYGGTDTDPADDTEDADAREFVNA